jgi:hypothetical protein
MPRRPRLRCLLLAGAAHLALAAPAAAVTVGLSEQQPATFADARVRALGIRYARLVVPWDAATSEPERVQAWLDAVAAAGMRPHVAFEHLRSERCPGAPCSVPGRARYRAAVAAFHRRFPTVRTFTTWNEANHRSQPVASRPEAVAGFFAELRAVCPRCTVVAGDVLDSGSYVRWLQRFLAASPVVPRLWGLHNYGDTTYGRTTGTDAVLAAVPGRLWLEETGGIVTIRDATGRQTLAADEARATRAIDRAFAIAARRPRITRMYLYHWRAGPSDRFDAGLVRPDGSVRPGLAAVRRGLAALAPVRWTAAWSGGRLVVRATCPAGVRRCAGRVRIALRTTARRRAGARTRALATRGYATPSTGRTATLRVALPRALRRRARLAARRTLVLAVRASAPLPASSTASVRVGRPR